MKSKYPHVFAPITIGGVTFKNRIWSAPAGAHLLAGREEYPNDHVIAYYANKARGGSANITVSAQNMDIHKPYDAIHANENIFNPETHRFWNQLTDAIHFYGAKASLELLGFSYHGYDYNGNLVSYSVNGDEGTQPLTRPVMEEIAKIYADAAEAALKCGFDMILIHGGHGLILSQMLSPLYNTRTDEFGGSLENRAKFARMILDAIRGRVGRKLLIEYRISGSELAGEQGFTTDDCVAFLKLVQDQIDIAHISAGSFFSDTEHIMHPNNFLKPGCNAYLAQAVKESGEIHIPVLTLGAFQQPRDIEDALAAGKADLVAMARGTIADAFLVTKARTDREDEIIPCIKCFHCLDYRRASTFGCAVNPTVGREQRLKQLVYPAEGTKRVVIVGGGPGGMEAAITARSRGHQVILLEQQSQLGGKLTFSRQVPFKRDLCKFMDYLIHMVDKTGVEVRLNTQATPELVESLEPDVVIAATGAKALVPPIPGVEGANVITAEEAYHRALAGEKLGERIAVLGGGDVGCETAVYLAQELGKQVSLVEMTGVLAQTSCTIPRVALTKEMEKSVEFHLNARCTAITDSGLTYVDEQGEHTLEADTVVLAAGMVPLNDQAEQFRTIGEEFFAVGDCVKAGSVRTAVRTGYDSAIQL
jgi:2,4-dienoyl-CoA reductase-like NADH-dependent reductase (Old Yellow Enzyme family)/thioredoxin reductase